MNIIIIICAVLIGFWKIKNQYAERIRLKYSYQLYDLRDLLRESAIKGQIKSNDWVFVYLDQSISKTVHELQYLNMLSAFMLSRKYRRDKDFKYHKHKLIKGIRVNSTASFIYEEYGRLLLHYVFEKQFIPMVAFNLYYSLHIKFYQRDVKSLVSKLKKSVANVRLFPETSALYEVVY